MYAPTSTNSPRSGPTSGDDDGLTDFDGAGGLRVFDGSVVSARLASLAAALMLPSG